MNTNSIEAIESLAKRRGIIFPSSEIYGGLANSWDYGPIGVELKNNIKQLWWQIFVHRRDDIVGIDAAIIMNPRVWVASGHLGNFTDPLIECGNCHQRFRVDQIINIDELTKFQKIVLEHIKEEHNKIEQKYKETRDLDAAINQIRASTVFKDLEKNEYIKALNKIRDDNINQAKEIAKKVDFLLSDVGKSFHRSGRLTQFVLNRHTPCPNCQQKEKWTTEVRDFNLMFKTYIGAVEATTNEVYLRPETAQAMFVNFKNVLDTTSKTPPFGIAQIGKAFRNEVTPGNFIFRTREFEQMEIEYFIPEPESDADWQEYFEMWRQDMRKWMSMIGLNLENVHEHNIPGYELAHYSKKTIDFEYDFPFGRKELYGLAYRTNFDLLNHEQFSGKDLKYQDQLTGKKYAPHVIEPTWGVDRSVLAVLCEAYTEEVNGDKRRILLKLNPKIAPYKIAVFPLVRNKDDIVDKAKVVYNELKRHFSCAWDDRGNIGKRYLAQDEVGTPWCVTIDYATLDDDTVTVRDRDTTAQVRMKIADLTLYFQEKLA